MTIAALALIEAARDQLDDHGGNTGPASTGYYAYWQEHDEGCLWRNVELTRYLNQTLRELGQRRPIKDRDGYPLALVAGVRNYALEPEIVRIDAITRMSDGNPLVKTTVAEMQAVTVWNRHHRELLDVDWRAETGFPTYYLLDEQQGTLTVYPTPVVDMVDALRRQVWRTYRTELSWDTLAHESTTGVPLLTTGGWTVGSGWTESPDDVFTHASGTAALTHSATMVSGTTYRLTYTITGRTAGHVEFTFGGQTLAGITASGATELPALSSAGFTVTPTTDFDGTLAMLLVATSNLTTLDEVPDHYFEALLAGICARAYRKRDADANAPRLAAECEAEFNRRVGPPISLANLDADHRWADTPGDTTPRTYFAW